MLAACSDTSDHAQGPAYGELGVGLFLYECGANGDPFCASGGVVSDEFPRAFMLGGRISLGYDWRDDDDHFADPLPQLQSASPERLARMTEYFTALETGYAAVIAVTGNSQIVDLVHLHIREPVAVQAVAVGMPGATPVRELSLEAGENADLQALVLDADDVSLGGAFGHTWTIADPAVLKILAGADTGRVQVSGVSGGTTTLTLTHGELTTTIAVTVAGCGLTSTSDSSGESSGDSSGDSTSDTGSESSGGSSGDTDTTGDSTSGSTGGAL